MKLFIISDIDTLDWEGGTGLADVLLSGGDLFDSVILGASEAYCCKRIFAVKGNHDSPAPFPTPIRDLHLRTVVHNGVTFGGLNGCWKYKPRGAFLYEQEEINRALDEFPPVDVLLTHNSPREVHDRNDGIHDGFDGLLSYIEKAQPKLVIHGHQHIDAETQIGSTRVVGVYGHRVIEI